MNTLAALGTRFRRTAVLAVVLLLLGTATATAYWVATATVESTTQAASMGITQELQSADALAGTYTADARTLAGVVALTNTGTRDAAPSLTVAASGEVLTDPSVLQVSVGLAGNQTCAPQAELPGAAAGPLGSELTPADVTVGPQETVDVCVRTTLSEDALTAHAGQELELAITSSLRYADGEQWTITAEQPLTVTQNVEQVEQQDPWADLPEVDHQQNGVNLYLYWKPADGSTHYRLSIAPADAPGDRSSLRSPEPFTDPTVHLHHSNSADQAALEAYVSAAPGRLGDALIFIEESAGADGTWTPAAVAEVELYERGNDIRIRAR